MNRQPSKIARVLLWFASFASLVDGQQVGIEQDRQRRLWEGLVARRMFTLAETLCREQMSDPSASPRHRAEWSGRLIRSVVENARQVPAAQRSTMWQKAEEAARHFAASDPGNPWNTAVQYQAAMALVARAESSVLPSELGLMDSQVALAELRSAAKALVLLETELEQQLRAKARGNTVRKIAGPTQLQLKTLRARVFDAFGRIHLSQARLYKQGTPDRLNSCLSAIQYFEKISPTDVPAEFWDQVQLNVIIALRLKRDFQAAERRLDRLLEADREAEMKLMARAERIRLALAQQQDERAQAYVTLDREVDGRVSADLDMARLETMLYQWKQSRESGQAESARSWREKAVELVAVIEREHSPFWLHRAETLLATAAAGGTDDDFDVLKRTARNLYLRGQLDESVVAYDQASAAAEAGGNAAAAFRFAFEVAAIQDQRGLHKDALRRFRSAASRFPSQSDAPRAHESAIVIAAEMALESADSPKAEANEPLQIYQHLLTEHLATWPNSPSAARVRLWLARLYEHQQEYALAAETYISIRDGEVEPRALFQRAKSCYFTALERTAERERKLHDALSLLREIAGDRPVNAQRISVEIRRREAILLATELQLRFPNNVTTSELEQPIRALETLLKHTPTTDAPPWRDRAHALMIAALAQTGNWDRVARMVEELRPATSETWLELLTLLARQEIAVDGSQRELGQLQWQLLKRISNRQATLGVTDHNRLNRWRAEAMMRIGDFASAHGVLDTLVQGAPNDVGLRVTFARSLSQSNQLGDLRRALEQWRLVLQHHAPQSPDWFRAKYEIAKIHHNMGHSQRAAEIIRLLTTLHPDLGGKELRHKFQTLLAECDTR